ncbi:hypothetical protein KKHFBJBL_00414 [Brevundimonas sp. NIBR11]|nr:hypothetical protein KKHFBJBL_00414 [Brevundimonas sp. NIBR11]
MDAETETLIQRWILAFCEAPPLIDKELMRAVLADMEGKTQDQTT